MKKRMTASEKYVITYFPNAKCKVIPLRVTKTQVWYVISSKESDMFIDLGASRKSETLAWRNAVLHVKEIIEQRLLEKLEQ